MHWIRCGCQSPPFARLPTAARRGARWVRPELVAEVRFQTWTADGMLRHASFQGLREDREPASVVHEQARSAAAVPSSAAPMQSRTLELHGVRISSADRPVLDRPRLTKGDVARYYAAMAELILPQVAGRPLSVIRCPERLDQGCFYQRHRAAGMPAAIRTVPGAGRDGKQPFLAIDDAQGLLALIQFGAIELHPNGARADRPERPDRLVFDLDPAEGLPFARVVAAAHELRERLRQLGLESFPRTTGGKGLHLVVPIERRHDWPEAKAFAGGLARAMQADSPDRYTAVLAKAARAGRIFVDYLRNDRTATAVASYSLRGRAHAPVAMPLGWARGHPRPRPAGLHHPDRARAGRQPPRSVGRAFQAAPAPAGPSDWEDGGLTASDISTARLPPLRRTNRAGLSSHARCGLVFVMISCPFMVGQGRSAWRGEVAMDRVIATFVLAAALVLLGVNSIRAQQGADEQAIEATNRAFYEAISAEDLAQLEAIWVHAPYVRAIHPPSLHSDAGWEAVRAGFEKLFASWSEIAAAMPEPDLRLGTDVAWVTGEEQFRARRPSGEQVSVRLLGTSVFEKVDGAWLMVHHHVSVPPRPLQ